MDNKQIYLILKIEASLSDDKIRLKDYIGTFSHYYTNDKAEVAAWFQRKEVKIFTFPEFKEIRECDIVLE